MKATAAPAENRADKHPENCSRASAIVFLSVLLGFNALLIATVAINHALAGPPRMDLVTQAVYPHLVAMESVLLLAPGSILGIALAWAGRTRLAIWLGALAMLPIPVLYYLDLLTYTSIGERLFAAKTLQVFWPLISNLSQYVRLENCRTLLAAAGIYLAAESAILGLARLAARELTARVPRRLVAVLLGLVGVQVLVVPAYCLMRPEAIRRSLHRYPERHPILASGLIDSSRIGESRSPALRRSSAQLTAQLYAARPQLAEFGRKYNQLSLAGPPKHTPDIVIVLAESLRADAFTPVTAPNLTKFGTRSTVCINHFSGGNGTELGFFGLLFGLDSALYPQAGLGDWQPALSKLLKAAGYHRAFFGTDSSNYFGMEKWIAARHFESLTFSMVEPYYQRDAFLIGEADKLLARDGPYANLKGKPVAVVLYLYTTHLDYSFTPEDVIATPYLEHVPVDYVPLEDRPALRNRYANSVHCLDRLLKPLLDGEAVVVVTGDHGESFGEDGRMFHATALSKAQTHAPFIMHVPGRNAENVVAPTIHADVVPTLLDIWGTEVGDQKCLSGRSILRAEQLEERHFTVREHASLYHRLVSVSHHAIEEPVYLVQLDLESPRAALKGRFDSQDRTGEARPSEAAEFSGIARRWLTHIAGGEIPAVDDPLEALGEALGDSDPVRRAWAATSLGDLGPQATAVLRQAVDDPDAEVRQAILQALAAIEDQKESGHAQP